MDPNGKKGDATGHINRSQPPRLWEENTKEDTRIDLSLDFY